MTTASSPITTASVMRLRREPSGGNWGLYTLFDQVLFPFGERAATGGLACSVHFWFRRMSRSARCHIFFTAGVASRGIFESRPIDVAGFGVVYGSFSSDLSNAQQREQLLDPATGVQDYETVFEWTYRFNLHKGALFIQPDIQYVINPGGTGQINDALVLGCPAWLQFLKIIQKNQGAWR